MGYDIVGVFDGEMLVQRFEPDEMEDPEAGVPGMELVLAK